MTADTAYAKDPDHEPAVIRMGNDIARHLEHLPAEDAAVELATHVKKFWEPRMRHELLAHLRWKDLTMHPLLVAACEHLVDGEYDAAEVAEPSGG